jgi:hypothetical protein
MVIAKNIGRLGNNLFQIAAAIGYARKYGYEWAVDPSSGTGEPYSAIHQIYPNLPKGQLGGARYHEHPHGHCPVHNTSYDICHFNYHPIPDLGPNVTLSGFFQSYKYFENATDEIKKVFALQHWTEYEDHVSIHVRRGDYVEHSESFPPITEIYLQKAHDEIFSKEGYRAHLIFSDDIEWCKQNIFASRMEFTTTGNPENISMMASCKHHIIANSTFSWWGAFLGHNPNRIVISPSCDNWFGLDNGVKQPVVDLLPPDWYKIKFR